MQGTQSAHMMDKCVHLVYSSTADDFGNPQATYTDGETLICGFGFNASSRELLNSTDVPSSDHQLRLPMPTGTTVSTSDRFRIIERFGVAVADPQVYEVDGPARIGPSGVVVKLNLVTI